MELSKIQHFLTQAFFVLFPLMGVGSGGWNLLSLALLAPA